MKRGHHPERTCIGCGARDAKRDLVRLIATDDGALHVDPTGRGRGGYLHRRGDCWEGFLRKKKLYRAFRTEFSREAKEKLVYELRK